MKYTNNYQRGGSRLSRKTLWRAFPGECRSL